MLGGMAKRRHHEQHDPAAPEPAADRGGSGDDVAPLDITVSNWTVLQPDLLVAARSTLTGRKMVGLPVLAVEVLSPSTRLIDLNLKRAAFERAKVQSYWVVDPSPVGLAAWDFVGDEYVQRAAVTSGEFGSAEPFPVTFDVAELAR